MGSVWVGSSNAQVVWSVDDCDHAELLACGDLLLAAQVVALSDRLFLSVLKK